MNYSTLPGGQAAAIGTQSSLMGIDDEEIARRKEWLEFTEDDIARVLEISPFIKSVQNEVIDELYDHFLKFDEVRAFFRDSQLLEQVKAAQKVYFNRLTEGQYDREYVENRLQIGAVHGRIG